MMFKFLTSLTLERCYYPELGIKSPKEYLVINQIWPEAGADPSNHKINLEHLNHSSLKIDYQTIETISKHLKLA